MTRVRLLMRCECSEHGGVRAHSAGRSCDSLRVAIVRLWDMNQAAEMHFTHATKHFTDAHKHFATANA